MRKKITFSLILAVCVVVLSFACVKTEASQSGQPNKTDKVITVANNDAESNPVLEARFLNMLNHSFVYNEDFYNDNALVDNSVLALLDLSEDSYIAEDYVKDYIFNMYGKIFDNIESDKEGYVYIIPRGYSTYTHKIATVTDNKDGSYTVITDVTISYEDDTEETLKAETVFLQAEDSAFGFNIMYSNIVEEVVDTAEC